MSPESIDERYARALRLLLILAFLLPAVTMAVGLLNGGLWTRIWLGAVSPMWSQLTPGWVWLVPLLVQFLLLVTLLALGYVVVGALVDRDGDE